MFTMEELQKNEKKEKAKRRSSILKPSKPRTPCEEIEITETQAEISMGKPVRRVSFASSNFIKQFAADPEKNTIWDSTYEEDVDHTNSTQSSKEHIGITSTKLEFTEIEASNCGRNITNVIEQSMELSQHISVVDKENIPVYPVSKIRFVDYTKKLSSGNVGVVVPDDDTDELQPLDITCQNINPVIETNNFCNDGEIQSLDCNVNEMSFTCQIPMQKKHLEISKTTQNTQNFECSSMDLTCPFPKKDLSCVKLAVTTNTTTTISCDLEFTEGQIKGGPECNLSKINDMEFTYQLPLKNNSVSVVTSKKLDVCDNITVGDMEFTCQVPKKQLLSKNATFVANDDMEFTCKMPQINKDGFMPVVKAEDHVNNINDDMEFTCKMPQINKGGLMPAFGQLNKTNDMEFTCKMPQMNAASKVPIGVETLEHINKSNMEFTCKMPQNSAACVDLEHNKNNMELIGKMQQFNAGGFIPDVKTAEHLNNTNDMEFTCKMPQNNAACVDVEHNKCNMELIGKMPQFNAGGFMPDVKTVEHLNNTNDMEFTCKMPQNNAACMDLEHNKSNMEFTCKRPQINAGSGGFMPGVQVLEHLNNTNDMEFTCKMPQNNAACVDRAHTLEQNKSNMEFTCKMPQINASSGGFMPGKKALDQLNNTNYMEFTQNNAASRDSISFGVQTLEDINKNNDMEFSCKMSQVNAAHINTMSLLEDPGNLTNMEFSYKKPQANITNIDSMLIMEDPCNLTRMKFSGKMPQLNLTCEPMDISEVENLTNSTFAKSSKIIQGVSKLSEFEFTDEILPTKESNCQNKQANVSTERRSHKITESSSQEKHTATIGNLTLEKDKLSQTKTDTMRKSFRENVCSMMEFDNITQNDKLNFTCHTMPAEQQMKTTHVETSKHCGDDTIPHFDVSFPKSGPLTPSQNKSKIPLRTTFLKNQEVKPAENATSIPESCEVRTPEPSFHINLTNISSGVDDTQHLLECTYSKPAVSFATSRLDNKSASCLLTLEDTHISKPNLTNISGLNSTDVSLCDLPRSKLANVNDTYVLKNKMDFHKNSESVLNDSSHVADESSLGIINVSDEAFDTESKSFERPKIAKKRELKKFDFTIRRASEIVDLVETVNNQRRGIFNDLQGFKFRPIRVPQLENLNENSRDSLDSVNETGEETPETLSIEEKIGNHQKSSRNTWKLESINGCCYHFSTLFGRLGFVVKLVEADKVQTIQTSDNLPATAKPLARFILKNLQNKLNNELVKSALGENYDVISLLDYVQMKMLELQKFQADLFKSEAFTMEKDFVAKFSVSSFPLVVSFNIIVDVGNFEDFKYDRDINVETKVGTVNENEIKKIAEDCPKNLDFFMDFHGKIKDYISLKEKRKQFRTKE